MLENTTETAQQNNGDAEVQAQAASYNAALAGDYVRRNFNYISRRIRDKLVYPPSTKRAGIQGTVEIIFTILKDGAVSGIRVSVSSGDSSLDAAALDAVKAAAPFKPPGAEVRFAVPMVQFAGTSGRRASP